MYNNNSGQGGQRKQPKFLGGRPQSDADYGTKKRFDKKPQHAGRGDRGGRGGGGRDGDRRQTEMFKAVCSTCQKACEVPFRPDGSKPVLCSECFGKSRSDERGGGFERRDRSSNDRPRRDFDAPRRDSAPSPDYKALLNQVSNLEGKVTEILQLLKSAQKAPAVSVEKPENEVAPIAKKKATAKKVVAKKVAKKAVKKTVKKAATKKAVKKS